jgi:hypothetical protein
LIQLIKFKPEENFKYYPTTKQVEEVDPAGPRAYHGTAVLGYCIYVIGGFDGMDYFNSCRCFDAVTKSWREVRQDTYSD